MVDPYRITEDWEEGYAAGFSAGRSAQRMRQTAGTPVYSGRKLPKKRKLSDWNKYVKANSKKPRFKYRSGKLNLKKMAIAFRKTPAGKKKGKR